MSTETFANRAARAILEDRVRVIRANERGIALDVTSSKPDAATLERITYRVVAYVDKREIIRTCTCPAHRRCYHMGIAELLWRPTRTTDKTNTNITLSKGFTS